MFTFYLFVFLFALRYSFFVFPSIYFSTSFHNTYEHSLSVFFAGERSAGTYLPVLSGASSWTQKLTLITNSCSDASGAYAYAVRSQSQHPANDDVACK